jgi:hypothetical protein
VPNGARTPEETLARHCGLQLLELSGLYERGIVRYEAGHETLAIAGLVGRQRRLLRAAYLLADVDQRLEASIMLRAMLEFLIRQRWLQLDPGLHYVLWVIEDLKARLRIDREVREQDRAAHEDAIEIMQPEIREPYERELDRMRNELDGLRQRLGLDRPPRTRTCAARRTQWASASPTPSRTDSTRRAPRTRARWRSSSCSRTDPTSAGFGCFPSRRRSAATPTLTASALSPSATRSRAQRI